MVIHIMFKIFPKGQKKEFLSKKEFSASNFIPYMCYLDENTIITKNLSLLQVIHLQGISFETVDSEDLDIKKNLRNVVFKNMELDDVMLYFHIIRTKKTKQVENIYPANRKDFVNYLQYKLLQKQHEQTFFVNHYYITILYNNKNKSSAISIIDKILDLFNFTSKKSQQITNMHKMITALKDVSNRLINAFEEYGAELLGNKFFENRNTCEISEFLIKLANCNEKITNVAYSREDFDKNIVNRRINFKKNTLEVTSSIKEKKYGAILSIREYCPTTYAGMLDDLLTSNFEFILTQSFVFFNRRVAITQLELQQNRMLQAEDKAESQIAEITDAIDLASSGTIGFGKHHLTLLCIEDSIPKLEKAVSYAIIQLSNIGMQVVRETKNMEPCFWGQLPGNEDYVVRQSLINTYNLASLFSMHNYPTGQKFNNHWGEYLMFLDNQSNTEFYFSFHVSDVGHSLIIGPTGAGKTVLMNSLVANACKFNPKMFFFDKDRGAEIFIRAIKGVYNVINPSVVCNFNPLLLENNSENKSFLIEWLSTLVEAGEDNYKVSSEERDILHEAVEGNFKLKKSDRRLSNIAPFFGLKKSGNLASRISMWYGEGSYAKIFDNSEDNIDFSESSVFGFEMSQILTNKVALPPILLYLFHRINMSLDGSKTIIVLDEAWALIDNPFFAPKIKDWLKVLRKLNTMVIFATQSVEDAAKSAISDTLVQQTATQIFLPNLKATSFYKEVFMLSEKEFNIIKNIDPKTRYFLLKQGTKSSIAKINLEGMDDIISVLSGNAHTVKILHKTLKKHGYEAKNWLEEFYKAVSASKKG